MKTTLRGTKRQPSLAAIVVVLASVLCGAQEKSKPISSAGDTVSNGQIEEVIKQYVRSVDELDLDLARKIWASGTEVTFIHPRGTEHGIDEILKDVYGNAMGTFSKRELLPDKAEIHIYNDTAWSQFTWTFHATVKNGGQNITTNGRETQVYHKENGSWRIVHVHYSGMPLTGALKGF